MNDFYKTRWKDLLIYDVFSAKDKDLRAHIIDLQKERESLLNVTQPSLNQIIQQIELAQHELSSRSTTRLSKLSIGISLLAILIASVGIVL